MSERRTRADVEAVVGQIRRYVPPMAPYFEIDAPLGEYAAGLHATGADPAHAERHELLARAVRTVLRQALGPAARVRIEAADVTAMNIVDHHQLLNHPLLLGTNIIANADRLLGGDDRRPIITFSCSNVAPGNSYMRGGFRFREETVPYFTAKQHRDAIYYTGSRRFDFVERLRAIKRWDRYSPCDQQFLTEYQLFLNGLDYSHTGRHRDQLTVALRSTWPLLFAEPLRATLPELLYATAEDVTRECLLELLPRANFLSAALFDADFRREVLAAFRGVVIAWDEAAGKGTHFFWRKYPGRPELLRMFVDGSSLVPADPRFSDLSVPLEPGAIADHLEREEIIPSVALCMSVLLHLGVRPLVGPGSLVYIGQLQRGWTELLRRHGDPVEAELIGRIDTGGLIAGTPMFFDRVRGTVRTLHAADVFSLGGMPPEYLRTVLRVPFRDLLSVGSSGVYELFANSYIPPGEQLTERIGFDEAAAAIHQWL